MSPIVLFKYTEGSRLTALLMVAEHFLTAMERPS